MKYPAGEIVRNGFTVEIFVDDVGSWIAEVGTEYLREKSRQDLEAKIAKLTKRSVVKVSIPFMRVTFTGWDGAKSTFRRGTATGVHSGNGNLLVEWPPLRGSGAPVREQLNHLGSSERIFKPLTAGELETYTELSHSLREAQLAHKKFLEIHQLGINGLKDAVLKAADETEIKETDGG